MSESSVSVPDVAVAGGPNLFSVDGLNVVIVGGTAGIGLAVAEHLAGAGARVCITGRRDAAALAESVGVSSVVMDITDESSVATGFSEIESTLGHVDCLVLNAGIDLDHGGVDELDVKVFQQIFDVNTIGIARAMAAGIGLVGAGGSVIVTSSPAGSITTPGMAAYSGSKAALDMLVRTWALELGPQQIRVNAVLPGIVESEMESESSPDVEVIRRMTANGVIRKATEMGPIYQFLASAASATLTGSLLGAHDGISVGYSVEVMQHLVSDLGSDT